MNHKVDCNILNIVEEDFTAIWEMQYVIRRAFPEKTEEEINDAVYASLASLLNSGLVVAYRGINFNDDEVLCTDFVITKDLISSDTYEREMKEAAEYRHRTLFLITPKG